MFVKRRKLANFNNNDTLANHNYENENGIKRFCLQHKNCNGLISDQVQNICDLIDIFVI